MRNGASVGNEMVSEAGSCPSENRLAAWMTGQFLPSEGQEMDRHVSSCARCRAVVERLESEDPLLRQLRGHRPLPDAFSDDPALQAALERAKSAPPPSAGFDRADAAPAGKDDAVTIDLSFLSVAARPEMLGRLGRYDVLGVQGVGGMGIVLRGHDPDLRRLVAIKVLRPEMAHDPDARRRFLREARAAATIKHDYVITVHAVEEVAPTASRAVPLPYLVMEFVGGGSLQDRISREGRLATREIVRIAREIAEGLSAAHGRGLIHRDIKPGNILLEESSGRVQITDFGLVHVLDRMETTWTGPPSEVGAIRGTPQYMSPEQAQGDEIDHRSDLFSLGSTIYAMLTGRPAFGGRSSAGTLHAVAFLEPPPIKQLNPDAPDCLVALVDRLMAKSPGDRYGSAQEVVEALGACLGQLDSLSTRAPEPAAAMTPPRRRLPPIRAWLRLHRMASLIGGFLFGGALLAGGILLRIKDEKGRRTEITVPPGSRVAIGDAGTLDIELPSSGPASESAAMVSRPVSGEWAPTGSLRVAREDHSATLLSNGSVLVVGGRTRLDSRGFSTFTDTCELYDPATGLWLPTGRLQGPARDGHRAVLLNNAMVLVTGGATATTISTVTPTNDCQLYSPVSGQWTSTAPLRVSRYAHSATVLDDGRVLVVGGMAESGDYLASCERYDPSTGTWLPAAPLPEARAAHVAVKLITGRVLVAAGVDRRRSPVTCFLYNPHGNVWSPTRSLARGHAYGDCCLLADGDVLIAGGVDDPEGKLADWHAARTAACEIYDPRSGVWSAGPSMVTPLAQFALVKLPGGDILRTGRVSEPERFFAAEGLWKQIANPLDWRQNDTATVLLNGKVLLAGGRLFPGDTITTACELYDPKVISQ